MDVHIWPKSDGQARMWQTFTPGASSLAAVDIDVFTPNPVVGDDTLTVEIAKDGVILASAVQSVKAGYDGLLRFPFTNAVAVTVGDSYELRVSGNGEIFGWRYGGDTYSGGVRCLNSRARPTTDWFFQTYTFALGD